jgi:phosphoribosylformylglycinamidine cyclo-ligase
MMSKPGQYTKSGVDIGAADKAKTMMKQFVETTFSESVIGEFGGFGGLYSLKKLTGKDLILVGSADGVGTKLKLAFAAGCHDSIGQDLVNHLVNDILCCGARPLFFFDYLGLGSIQQEVVLEIIKGLSIACKENGCALLGGETAQMPGFYAEGEYDIAGFMVGWVEKDKLVDGKKIKPGDRIIGLASNGLHTNGYSLARKMLFDTTGLKQGDKIPETGTEVYSELMKIHRSYLSSVEPFIDKGLIKGIAHVTGGGFEGNISRIMPDGISAVIDTNKWPVPGVFRSIQKIGSIAKAEMYQVFNMGIGMVLISDAETCNHIKGSINNIEVYEIGHCEAGQAKVKLIL